MDKDSQQLIAFHTHISWQAPERTIWMDGRDHPPDYVPHTWQGFSTGKWEGDVLTVTTTHLKTGWIRRNAGGSAQAAKGGLVIDEQASREMASGKEGGGTGCRCRAGCPRWDWA